MARAPGTAKRMDEPDIDLIHIAARRLRGQLVAAPLVAAAPGLPGLTPGRDLRLKLEMLQPAGGVHFRGALHYLLRQLGRFKGVAVAGSPRSAYAAAFAASLLRLPVRCFLPAAVDAEWGPRFAALGCEHEIAGDPQAAARDFCGKAGYCRMPGLDEPDLAAGLATVGLELSSELPAHCARLFVVEELAPAVGLGLAAGGHPAEVVPVAASTAAAGAVDDLGGILAREHRVIADPEGLAVLAAALEDRTPDCTAALLSC